MGYFNIKKYIQLLYRQIISHFFLTIPVSCNIFHTNFTILSKITIELRRYQMTKTFYAKKEEIDKKWFIIDAKDKVLGRVASKVAHILRGKHKPEYTPSVDMGDFIVIINADKVRVTGNKQFKKNYYHHSGYPGGLREIPYYKMMEKDPTFALKNAIKGMLPHNRLGRKQLKHVKIYAGENHPHAAQQPDIIDI